MSSHITRNQKAQQEAEKQAAGHTEDTTPPSTSTEAMFAQLMARFDEMSLRLGALEAKSSAATSLGSPFTPQQLQQGTPQMTPQASQQGTQQATQPVLEDKRWRPEDVGYFDGTGDVYAFIDRLKSVATNKSKGVNLVQTNLVTVLKDKAFNWYHYELSAETKGIYNMNILIDPWCDALIERFGPSHKELVARLEACQYTRKDAANRKDATEHIQEIMKITKGLKWNQEDSLMTAFHHFEAGLQRDLDPPSQGGLTSFIKQVQLRQEAWYQVYAAFGQKLRPPDLSRPSQQSYQHRPQQPYQSRPQYSQQPRPQYSQQPRPSQPAPPSGPPRVYWADQEEEEDWVYDAPTDSYHVASAYPATHGPGHAPRRYGNTHDDGGTEAMVNWTSAGEDHRCGHEGCTHYH